MIRFRSLELKGWSVLPWQRLPIHDSITLLVGQNGCGKTTFLDAMRTLVGASRFDNGRTFKTYIERDIEEIVLVGVLDNQGENSAPPLARIGIHQAAGSFICRITRTSEGNWERKFAIVNGEVSIANADFNSYHWMGPVLYREQLAKVGVSRTVIKVISLDQGSTDRFVQYKPAELADYVLDICGDKSIIDSYNETKEKLTSGEKALEALKKDLTIEESRLDTEELRVEKWRDIVKIKNRLKDLEFSHPIAEIKNLTRLETDANREGRNHEEVARKEQDNYTDLVGQKVEIQKSFDAAQELNTELQEATNRAMRLVRELSPRVDRLETETNELVEFLERYKLVKPIPIDELEASLKDAENERRHKDAAYYTAAKDHEIAKDEVYRLEQEQNIRYPGWVEQMRESLALNSIEYMLVAEYVEIIDPKWRNAVEFFLGRERFTLVIPGRENDLIRAKETGEQSRYGAYIQGPSESRQQVKPGTLRSVVKVGDVRIAGCLDFLNKVHLVDSVREGHELSKQGLISITPEAYRQDHRGGISLWKPQGRHYCGKKAFENHLEMARLREGELRQVANAAEEACEQAKKLEHEIADTLETQRMVKLVPSKKKKHAVAANNLEILREQLESVLESHNETQLRKRENTNTLTKLYGKVKELEGKIEASKNLIRSNRESATEAYEKAKELKRAADRKTLQLIPLQKEKLSDTKYTENLKSFDTIKDLIDRERDALKDVDEQEYRGVEEYCQQQRATVDSIKGKLNEQVKAVSEHKTVNEEALQKYIQMIKRVLAEVENHVRTLAKECKAFRVRCRFQQQPMNPTKWAIDYRVSFDGKEFMMYNHPRLSGGQKVITSLLLMMAAARAEGSAMSFMLLDEPTAHLDSEKTRELGGFLQSTPTQYVLSIPNTPNVQYMDFVDMCLLLGKKREEELMAPKITYARARPEYVAGRLGGLF